LNDFHTNKKKNGLNHDCFKITFIDINWEPVYLQKKNMYGIIEYSSSFCLQLTEWKETNNLREDGQKMDYWFLKKKDKHPMKINSI